MQKNKFFMFLKKQLTNLILLFFFLIALVLAIEFFFLSFPGMIPDSVEHLTKARIYNYDPELFAILKSNLNKNIYLNSLNKTITIKTTSYDLNEVGFRDNSDKLTADKRILILGDSFTFGYGVSDENTFVHYLEQILKKNGFYVDVINGGVTGYSSKLELAYYKRFCRELNPDIVIVALWKNDFNDNYIYEHAPFLRIRGWLTRHSMLYNTWGGIYRCIKRINNTENNNPKEKISFELESEKIKEGYRIERENLLELSKLVEEDSALMVLLVLPGNQNIHLSQLYNKNDSFILIDLSPETQNIPDLIHPIYGHYTEESSKIVAELIYSNLVNNPRIVELLKRVES